MTLREALEEGNKLLKEKTEASWLDASLILSFVIGQERWYLTAHDDEALADSKRKKYFELIEKRLSGVPLQYITNKQEFMSLSFFVNPSVLIPRPDTEILVEEVLNHIKIFPKDKTVNILDIGTGSGCIAVSIARYAENARIKAVDISRDAIEIAYKNSVILNVAERIEFVVSDLFQQIKNECFDIIVSNPPYIPTCVIDGLQDEVRKHEPMTALDGGEDGLNYYRNIISQAFKYLAPKGLLALEIGYNQGEDIREISKDYKEYSDFRIIKDLAGRNRVVCLIKRTS